MSKPVLQKYEEENKQPFIVDYYKIGSYWKEKMGGYREDVALLDEYIGSQIDSRKIENSLKGVEAKLKEMEKINNLQFETNLPVKMGVLSKYAKFLMDCDKIRYDSKKYGS